MTFKEKVKLYLSEEEELLPNLTSKEDLKFIKNAKLLNILDKIKKTDSFKDIMYDINYLRKSEGLEPLHKNDILSKYLTKKIKDKKNIKSKGKPYKVVRIINHFFIPNKSSLEMTKIFGNKIFEKYKKQYNNKTFMIKSIGIWDDNGNNAKDILNILGVTDKKSNEIKDIDDTKIIETKSKYKYITIKSKNSIIYRFKNLNIDLHRNLKTGKFKAIKIMNI